MSGSRARRRQAAKRPAIGLILFASAVLLLCLSSIVFLPLRHRESPAPPEPETATLPSAPKSKTAALCAELDAYASARRQELSERFLYNRPVYTLPEKAAAGPAFDRSRYVHTTDPAVIQSIIDGAAVLLDGQALCWTPDTPLMEDSEMVCYCDETIFVLCWKEVVNDCCLSFSEVRIADGSQLRRALAGGSYSYGPGPRIVETEFADRVNAVVSMNGDFYDYRKEGITVYQREIYRNNPYPVDSCFFTASGDMLFSHRGELAEEGEAERFVKDNDVVFALAFGPILVENGEATHTDYYPIGEVHGQYSRAAIGQLGELHYLLMTCGFDAWYENVPDINQTAQYIQAKGVEKAYALDGGGTAEIVIDGRSFNHVDFDKERAVSDIIYFATALPEF
ncbi:MAG: phosphodiester glycosidase family protein [Oscillospiraceae bacterium]|nr:phosphodiester glycosidase family protein [Oscillospiraceae bacterium]